MAQSAAPTGGPALEGTTWMLTALAGSADESAVPAMNADLILAGGTASGFGGCNQFTTSYTLAGTSLSFGVPASTMMACADPAMAFESVYLGALPTVASYAITGDTLELLDGSGSVALTYAAAPAGTNALVGTWTVNGINNGAEAVVSVPADPVLTVTFGADGSVVGFGGCNQFGGPYISGSDTIGIGPLHATMMACGDPLDTTEQQLMTALQASTVWSVRGGTLELRDDSGALQVELLASAPVTSPAPA
jgi:heat shock protein HslJ